MMGGGGLGAESCVAQITHTCKMHIFNQWVALKKKKSYSTFTSTSFTHRCPHCACLSSPSWSIINASDARPPSPFHTQPPLHPSLLHHLTSSFSPSVSLHPVWSAHVPFNETGSSVDSTILLNLLCQASRVCPADVFLCLWQRLGFGGDRTLSWMVDLSILQFLYSFYVKSL